MATPIDDLPIEVSQGGLQTRYVEWGDMAVRHARVPQVPTSRLCWPDSPTIAARAPTGASCSRGRSTSCTPTARKRHARAGDVYHWPAGHTARTDEATTFIEVGPVETHATVQRTRQEHPRIGPHR